MDRLLARSIEKGRTRELAGRETLFRQGDRATAIFLVEAGRLRLVRRTVDDHLVTLHTANAGDLLAEAALFADRYHCDALAVMPSRVRVLDKARLKAAMRANADLAEAFAARLAHQLQAVRARLELRNVRSARRRLLEHLALATGHDGRTVALDGQLQDVAAELGLTREAFYRTLAGLEADGAIVRGKGRITLRKPPAA